MSKLDINVSKKMTINTGNYSSIQPSVSITAKDVPIEDIKEAYNSLNVLTSFLFIQEVSVLSELQGDFKSMGIKKFLSEISKESGQVQSDVEEAIEKIKGISFKF